MCTHISEGRSAYVARESRKDSMCGYTPATMICMGIFFVHIHRRELKYSSLKVRARVAQRGHDVGKGDCGGYEHIHIFVITHI